ncbi:hypothetical protein QLQ12_05985 [Actinoplanes sp. NEAU-A12]|uniref:Uncharacterized protein n=1 Tax=Actinoplanes sandaracinus TaxID=3045177 RepID=A0ABT6WEK3_9ACTN|nr:hypothetical protein [Actinoplanes sandaracinus]MDI6098151.1 hypothetical protein [Actinoplanes sandaracinus]
MSSPDLQGWHVSLFVTVAILLIQVIVDRVIARVYDGEPSPDSVPEPRKEDVEVELAGTKLRTGVLVVVGGIALPVFAVSLLGPTLADQLAGVTGTVLGGVTLLLAWRTREESKRLAAEVRKLSADAEKKIPPAP